jgi:hypothetical protein
VIASGEWASMGVFVVWTREVDHVLVGGSHVGVNGVNRSMGHCKSMRMRFVKIKHRSKYNEVTSKLQTDAQRSYTNLVWDKQETNR